MFKHNIIVLGLMCFTSIPGWSNVPSQKGPDFEVSFPASVSQHFITGRVFVMLSRTNDPEVRLQVGWINSPPFFGLDVEKLNPGATAVISDAVPGFPLRSVSEIPAGDYYVQALFNVYTEFHRADGHVIWAHMDQWEGQKFNISPGNLYSKVQKIHYDPSLPARIRLTLTEVIPPIEVPSDTEWVKHVKIQSKLLTAFWGHPMYLGAVILLPSGYSSHPNEQYPVIYEQGHFSQDAPFAFTTTVPREAPNQIAWRENVGVENGYEFYEAWRSREFPQIIAVSFLHPTPYYDDSYAVNSANNGPYGDAIMSELIPYLEHEFRIIRQPYARILSGGSTGGWEALALQVYHPDFFGGTWTLYPDPVDFRRYLLVNIYEDRNSFVFNSSQAPAFIQSGGWNDIEQPIMRSTDGHLVATIRQDSQLEEVLGVKGRSTGVLEAWEAVYGPVGDDGYPKPLWDKKTGQIDHHVADYMRSHGYDLDDFIKTHWPQIGHALIGKLHVFCGDMDNFYLNTSVYLLQKTLDESRNPHYPGSFEYGRPMKGHGWQPATNAGMVRMMARYIADNAPRQLAERDRDHGVMKDRGVSPN